MLQGSFTHLWFEGSALVARYDFGTEASIVRMPGFMLLQVEQNLAWSPRVCHTGFNIKGTSEDMEVTTFLFERDPGDEDDHA